MNPIIAGLSIVLVSVLSVGAALIRSRRPPPPPEPSPDDEAPPAPRGARPELAPHPRPRAAAALPPCVPLPENACVVGRIEFPREIAEHPEFEELGLTAKGIGGEDGDEDQDGECFEGEVLADGRFELQLPAGDYDLLATGQKDEDGDEDRDEDGEDGDGERDVAFIGGVDALHVDAGDAIDGIVIAMDRAARIRGRLRGMMGVAVDGATVKVRRTGRAAVIADVESADDGTFAIGGLRAGSYQLSVDESAWHRGRQVPGVQAPVDGLTVDLVRRPILLGAVRPEPDGSCPETSLAIVHQGGADADHGGQDDGWEATVSIDDRCTFRSEALPGAGSVRLEGSVRRAPVSLVVIVPPAGDPMPVCLGTPCPSDLAVLAVGLASAHARGGEVDDDDDDGSGATEIGFETVQASDQDGSSAGSISMSSGVSTVTTLEGVPVGLPVRVWAQRGSARAEEIVVPGPGVHELLLHLVRR